MGKKELLDRIASSNKEMVKEQKETIKENKKKKKKRKSKTKGLIKDKPDAPVTKVTLKNVLKLKDSADYNVSYKSSTLKKNVKKKSLKERLLEKEKKSLKGTNGGTMVYNSVTATPTRKIKRLHIGPVLLPTFTSTNTNAGVIPEVFSDTSSGFSR